MHQLTIQQVGPSAILTLQSISRQIFLEAFADTTSEANMKAYLDSSFSYDKLMAELEHPNSQFYFAFSEGNVVGYLKLNTGDAQTEQELEEALEIERIYVLSAFHGQKVGQALLNKAFEVAEALQCKNIWLGVWENNQRALRFYSKAGFEVFNSHVFRLGNDEQTDLMMKKQL
ncbi:GNAT family N-acetyltransferase [Pedobacter sp. HDW13]|uniref:GNAT family N-acetyltransferase n=1 Tax=unclassified Pedobacter TaxID=2628915 RepID=UPI000F5AD0CB|nr:MULTISPECIES: GNAT family N-acetyltransferase [unclassified Pedobacter]QIL42337.1 GNAT family N-acetyltransferase [Pedobacter sp. HDW13]RQO76421.1 GNAT family N-acetyltransferase [Pedobacter sp. KBW01]